MKDVWVPRLPERNRYHSLDQAVEAVEAVITVGGVRRLLLPPHRNRLAHVVTSAL